jgi:hypothetical protein
VFQPCSQYVVSGFSRTVIPTEPTNQLDYSGRLHLLSISVRPSTVVCTLLVFGGPLTFASSQKDRSQEQSLDAVIQRAVVSVASFERDFAAVVAEERLEQRASNIGFPETTRTTRADLLLVRVPGRDEWVPFRDVFEVNGRAVRDRSERLKKLFIDTPETALTDAARISNESSRYNIGSVIRTINVPTFALIVLRPAYLKRFEFRKRGEETIAKVRTWRVEFVERTRPTVVRTLRGNNVPLEGSLWIDPLSGRVLRTLVKTLGTPNPGQPIRPRSGDTLMLVVVTYAPSATLGFWVPETMSEWSMGPDRGTVSATATYSNFRRFEVSTSERLTPQQ